MITTPIERELTEQEVLRLPWRERVQLAESGKYLDVLKDNEEYVVRRSVARQGWFLGELKDDEDECVGYMAEQQLEKVKHTSPENTTD